jgi:hypothetical protein
VVEGAADAANSLLKMPSGRLASRTDRKRRMVLPGYSVSSSARPFIARPTSWLVFTIRGACRAACGSALVIVAMLLLFVTL